MASKYFKTKTDATLHYVQTGNIGGRLILFLHGLGGSSNTFNYLVSGISDNYNIVLLDFPGFGQSPRRTHPATISDHVSDVHEIITSLQADQGTEEKLILVGHSLGSIVALHFAAKHPELVVGLALVCPGRSASHVPTVKQRMLDMAENTRKKGISWAAALAVQTNFPASDEQTTEVRMHKNVYDAVAASDPEMYAQTCEMMVDKSHVDPDYGRVMCPVLLVAGRYDRISPIQKAQEVAELLGSNDCSLLEVETGHQPILQEPEILQRALSGLMDKIAA